VHGIFLTRNYGQHNALLCGIRAARSATLVTMDDDLQHPPELLPTLVQRLTPEIDGVYGGPEQEQHGRLRDLASVITVAFAPEGSWGAPEGSWGGRCPSLADPVGEPEGYLGGDRRVAAD
jgi:undecaprenyl-phosphate 4-deoxy-4-formamido-L-arabinose transferase